MPLVMEADSNEVQPYQQHPGRRTHPNRLVVVPDAIKLFNLPDKAELKARVSLVAGWTDWKSNGRADKCPTGGLLLGFPGCQTYNQLPDTVLHAIKLLQFLAIDQDLAMTIYAHNLRRDNVEPWALWKADYPGKAVRADLVFDDPVVERQSFDRQLSNIAWRVYGVGFNSKSPFDSLDNGYLSVIDNPEAVTEVIHLMLRNGDLVAHGWQLFSTGIQWSAKPARAKYADADD